jgi:hypothetical protein
MKMDMSYSDCGMIIATLLFCCFYDDAMNDVTLIDAS